MGIWYVDTSALVKLVCEESESAALMAWLGDRHGVISDLHRTELRRAALRVGASAFARAEVLLNAFDLLSVGPSVFDSAGQLSPPSLRSLDALHLAAARTLGDDLEGFVCYDTRLSEAARAAGLTVAAPA
jgi:uncharacterized protein